jgi:hypothetical protein
MEEALRFFKMYELWIYLLLGLGGLLYAAKFARAWNELRRSSFGLERGKRPSAAEPGGKRAGPLIHHRDYPVHPGYIHRTGSTGSQPAADTHPGFAGNPNHHPGFRLHPGCPGCNAASGRNLAA